jgi:solute carrier family 25 thiamine pyrophosphate transporter 19
MTHEHRKRLQVQGPTRTAYLVDSIPKYGPKMTLVSGIISIIKTEGWLSLYKGLWPALLKSGPSSAITFLIYEQCKECFVHA